MKIVLLSGGSGKRLWPMSNDVRSKQFLRVLPSDDAADRPESMLQRVWGQLDQCGLRQDTYVCASKAQSEMIFAQLGSVPFIEEPARRDTFPAIALSTLYLLDVEHVSPEESVVISPVDHYVDDHYFSSMRNLADLLVEAHADIALMGVTPTHPTNKFGYMVPSGSLAREGTWQVSRFVEKPDAFTATQLIADGALWNCGVFCFRAGMIRDILQLKNWPSTYEECLDYFSTLPKRSFDYEVLEHAQSIVALSYSGEWNDLGTWESLSERMSEPVVGRGVLSHCEDTQVINELGIPVVTMGLDNAMVVATPDGILAMDKGHSAELKSVVGEFQHRPMYEERLWGNYRVLDYQKLEDGTEVLTKSIELQAGRNISYQMHLHRSEVWTVIEGTGEVILGTLRFTVGPGDVIRVPAHEWHAIRSAQGMKFIEIQRGEELVEEDIVRKYLTWAELEAALESQLARA